MESPLSLASAVEILSHWNPQTPRNLLFHSEVTRYLQAVNIIQGSTVFTDDREKAINMAVAQLSYVFRSILARETPSATDMSSGTQSSSVTDSAGSELLEDYKIAYDGIYKEANHDLRSITGMMHSLGHLGECVDLYTIVRKPFVNTLVKQLSRDNLSMGDIWGLLSEQLKTKIDMWIGAAFVSVQVVFPREKKLIEDIFGGLGSAVSEECFVATVKDAAAYLFEQAASADRHPRSPRKLFTILDLYKALLVIVPDINILFASESFESIRTHAAYNVAQLKEAIKGILLDFETSVVYDLSPIKAGGTIHRLTKYVMDYVSLILKYKKILNELMVTMPSISFGDQMIPDVEFVQLEGKTLLELHLVLVIADLRFNLEGKSKKYEAAASLFEPLAPRATREQNASLVHLFMANNIHYILQQIEGCLELQVMMGEDYINKLNEDLRQSISSFQITACSKIVYCLRIEFEGLHKSTCLPCGVSKSALISKRIMTFNSRLEEICGTRAKPVVSDLRLWEKLCQSIVESLVPVYESFLQQLRNDIEIRKHPPNDNSLKASAHIKYSVDDLQTLITENFFCIRALGD